MATRDTNNSTMSTKRCLSTPYLDGIISMILAQGVAVRFTIFYSGNRDAQHQQFLECLKNSLTRNQSIPIDLFWSETTTERTSSVLNFAPAVYSRGEIHAAIEIGYDSVPDWLLDTSLEVEAHDEEVSPDADKLIYISDGYTTWNLYVAFSIVAAVIMDNYVRNRQIHRAPCVVSCFALRKIVRFRTLVLLQGVNSTLYGSPTKYALLSDRILTKGGGGQFCKKSILSNLLLSRVTLLEVGNGRPRAWSYNEIMANPSVQSLLDPS